MDGKQNDKSSVSSTTTSSSLCPDESSLDCSNGLNPCTTSGSTAFKQPDERVISKTQTDDLKKEGENLKENLAAVFVPEKVSQRQITGLFPEKLALERRQNSDLILDLPADLVENILNRLPVKSIVRFQISCKDWMTLFTQRRFIYAHLNNSHNHTSFLHSRESSQIWMLEDLGQSPRYFKLQDFEGEHIRGISTCDGLILFYTYSRKIAIWNCNLGVCRWLASREYLSVYDHYSLGRTRDMVYKVLRFTILGRIDNEDCFVYDPEAEIYDVNSHRWKSLEMAENWGLYRQKFVMLSLRGNSFWLAQWFRRDEVFVQSFNFSTESFIPIELPFVVKPWDKTTSALSCFQSLSFIKDTENLPSCGLLTESEMRFQFQLGRNFLSSQVIILSFIMLQAIPST